MAPTTVRFTALKSLERIGGAYYLPEDDGSKTGPVCPPVLRGGRDRLHPPPLEVGRPVRAVRHAVRRRRGIRRGIQATHLLIIPSIR